MLHDPTALALDRAAAWLQTQQARDGLLNGWRYHASWLAIPIFAANFGEDTRATRRLISSLGRALNDEWAPSMLASLLQWLLAAGYTPRTGLVAHAWELLERSQAPDGSFATEDEAESTVEATLTALAVARRLASRMDRRRG